MKHFSRINPNNPDYWDAYYLGKKVDFENKLRQEIYWELTWFKERVVELGCGLSPYILRFSRGVGMDYATQTVHRLKRTYPFTQWVVGDACQTPFISNQFDAVVAGELIEHLEDPEKLLAEMERICKPGGRMVLSTPILEFEDPEHLWEFDEAYFINKGFETMLVPSEKFPGRSYIFAWRNKN